MSAGTLHKKTYLNVFKCYFLKFASLNLWKYLKEVLLLLLLLLRNGKIWGSISETMGFTITAIWKYSYVYTYKRKY